MVRRITRIYLPYIVAVSAAAVLMLAVGQQALPSQGTWFNISWEDPLTARVAWHTIAMTGTSTFIDNPVWSLIWEMRISAIFPAMMAAALIFGDVGLIISLGVLVVLYGSAHLLHLSGYWINMSSQMLAFTLLFALGAFCAHHVGAIRRLCARGPKWLPMALLMVGLLLLCPQWSKRALVEIVPLAIGSGLVVCAVMLPGPINTTLQRRLPLWLGRVSFSLYLIHVPILLAMVRLTHGWLPIPIALVAGASLALLLAEGFHRLIEQPCQRLGRRLTTKRTKETVFALS